MAFTLPSLPYSLDALAPHLSRETLELHHGKHHQTYVDKLNELVDGKSNADLEDVILGADDEAVFNNAAQHWNHSFYWEGMSPDGGGQPSGELAEAIDRDFGSYDAFRKELASEAETHFASGWAWLVHDGSKLLVASTHDADLPLKHGQRGAAHHRRVGARVLRRLPQQAARLHRGVPRRARELGLRRQQLRADLGHRQVRSPPARRATTRGRRGAASRGGEGPTRARRPRAGARWRRAGRAGRGSRRATPNSHAWPTSNAEMLSVDTMNVTTVMAAMPAKRSLVGVPGAGTDEVVAGLVGRHEQQQRDGGALVEAREQHHRHGRQPDRQRALDGPPGVGDHGVAGLGVGRGSTPPRTPSRRGRRARRRPRRRWRPGPSHRPWRPRRPDWGASGAGATRARSGRRRPRLPRRRRRPPGGFRARGRPGRRGTRPSRGEPGARRCRTRRRSDAGAAARAWRGSRAPGCCTRLGSRSSTSLSTGLRRAGGLASGGLAIRARPRTPVGAPPPRRRRSPGGPGRTVRRCTRRRSARGGHRTRRRSERGPRRARPPTVAPGTSSRPVPAASRAPANSRSTANGHLLGVRRCACERSDGSFEPTQPPWVNAGGPGRFARHDPRAADPPRAVRVERRRALAGPSGPAPHRSRPAPGDARRPQPGRRRRHRGVGPAASQRDGVDHRGGARRGTGGARARAAGARRRRVVGAHARRDRARLAGLPRLAVGRPARRLRGRSRPSSRRRSGDGHRAGSQTRRCSNGWSSPSAGSTTSPPRAR